jgi:phosphoribosylaminoimidazolecarboxamide formyltransferase/IMP cyclohydrolase
MDYDIAINNYFNADKTIQQYATKALHKAVLRYGENPHQQAAFYGNLTALFTQLNGKELSYNNLVDVDAAIQLIKEFNTQETVFAIIKHTNVCGIASRKTVKESWDAALAGDNESAFGGILITNAKIDEATATAINELFFEVLIAPDFDEAALALLKSKKNRILLQLNNSVFSQNKIQYQEKSLLNGVLTQQTDEGNFTIWKEVGGRITTEAEKKRFNFCQYCLQTFKEQCYCFSKK